MEIEINEIIKQDEELNLIYNTLTSIKGIKDKTAHTLISPCLPELGHTNRKQIVCICGLAPMNNDSGVTNRKMHTTPGGKEVKEVLKTIASLLGRRNNPLYNEKIKLLY